MGSPHGHVIIILCPPHCILGFVWDRPNIILSKSQHNGIVLRKMVQYQIRVLRLVTIAEPFFMRFHKEPCFESAIGPYWCYK